MPPKRPIDAVEGASEHKPPEAKKVKAKDSVEKENLAEDLYNYCNNRFTTDDTFQKEDLFDSNLFPDRKTETLRPVLQNLVDRKLFKICGGSSGPVSWRLVNRSQAAKCVILRWLMI